MEVVAGMDPAMPLRAVAAHAARVEALGFDVLHVAETTHDSLAVALLALEHTERLRVRTSVTLAFPRSPTLTAYAAWDLARFSGGRFELGLGTQVRGNIEGRYGMPWSEPVERLREYVGAIGTLYAAFREGGPLRFDGRHYRLDRLQPYFNPGPTGLPDPPLWLGGVNARMCRLAGERADGFVTHPTNSGRRYLDEVCLPNLRAGETVAGRPAGSVRLVVGTPWILGRDRRELDAAREHQRRLLAFLYSTPAYRRTLELHGWSDLGARLLQLTRQERWEDLPSLVTDEVLAALVPESTWDDLPSVAADLFGGIADGLIMPPPSDRAHDARFAEVVAALRGL
jgi:probable F420-dependent oxidoreductase